MLEFEQLKLRLTSNEAELRDLKDALGYERLTREIEELETKASAPGFWDDIENSQKIVQRTGKLKNTVETYDGICSSYEDLLVLIEMGDEEEDLSLVEEIAASWADNHIDSNLGGQGLCRLDLAIAGSRSSLGNASAELYPAGSSGLRLHTAPCGVGANFNDTFHRV